MLLCKTRNTMWNRAVESVFAESTRNGLISVLHEHVVAFYHKKKKSIEIVIIQVPLVIFKIPDIPHAIKFP